MSVAQQMQLVVQKDGTTFFIYSEMLDLACLGQMEIRRASQEAPEAIDRQRLPRSAGDMARGYFDKLRGDRDKKEKP